MSNLFITPIPSDTLSIKSFQESLKAPEGDKEYVARFIQENFEFAYENFTIIHACYDQMKDTYFGFVSLRVAFEIDDLPGLYVELIYLKPEYRKVVNPETEQKFSFDLLDYVFSIGINLQKNAAVNHIFLVPVTEQVREIYNDYGFENIPSSGKNEFEDYMVLNLIEEDASIR